MRNGIKNEVAGKACDEAYDWMIRHEGGKGRSRDRVGCECHAFYSIRYSI